MYGTSGYFLNAHTFLQDPIVQSIPLNVAPLHHEYEITLGKMMILEATKRYEESTRRYTTRYRCPNKYELIIGAEERLISS